MAAMAPFLIFIVVLLLIIIICLTIKHWPVNKASLKVNQHGLSYKTRLYGRDNFNLGFYDDKTKSIIWLLYQGINHDYYNWQGLGYRPKLSLDFFKLREIEYMINRFKSIEEVHSYNDRAKERTIESIIKFDKAESDLQNKINKYS